MGIKEYLQKTFSKDEQFAEMQRNLRLQKKLEQRQKNSNERELERYEEENRQKMIKQKLNDFRQKQKEEFFRGKSILDTPNIFTNSPNIFAHHKSILKSQGSFVGKGGFLTQTPIFFK